MENLTQNIQKLIRQINQKIALFFVEREYPTTLSIFRIVLFGYILYFVLNKYDYSYIELFSNIPKELKFLPGTFGALIEHFLPINKTVILILHRVLIITCFTAMIGFKSRISALLVVISGFYILGIPQLYGKVNHYHHLLWFASILAASPCSDFLSVDAIFRAWRQTTPRSIDESCIPSRAYALPLKFVYLLIGIIYFFPGFWKVRTSGLAWALSENLKFQLYNKWHSLGGWMPIFRIDEYPILYKLSALGSLVFEIGFIFIILFPRLRFLAAISGLIFHNMTRLLMRIPFVSLQICYVAFFDWHNIFCQVGKLIYKQEMHVFYRGNSDVHCKIIAALKTFDIFHQITYISTLDNHRVAQCRSNFVDLSNSNLNLAAVVGQRVWLNFEAYQAMAIRIPLLWPFMAPLYVWCLFRRKRYVEPLVVAQQDGVITPENNFAPDLNQKTTFNNRNRSLKLITFVGSCLLFVSTLFGVKQYVNAWPFACYPTFSKIVSPQRSIVEIVTSTSEGNLVYFDESNLRQRMSPEKYAALVGRVLASNAQGQEEQSIRLEAFLKFLVDTNPELSQVDSISFYRIVVSTVPEDWSKEPMQRNLLLKLDV